MRILAAKHYLFRTTEYLVKMKLTLDLVEKKYIETLQKKINFEEVSLWASEIIYKDEHGELEYDSSEDISLLFSALTYLLGLSTEVSPGNYLYTLEDVKSEYDQIFN